MRSLVRWAIEIILIAALMLGALMWGINHGIAEGRSTAMKEAFRTNPPSEQLEMTCLGLWLGEQNKKYYNKENRNAR